MHELATFDLMVLSGAAMLFGIFLLVKGGDWTVDGAIWVADRLGVSRLLIGFTVVAFGTSLPELFVSVNANLQNQPGISLGNVIGSNIANILLVIGATALFGAFAGKPSALWRDVALMLAATAAIAALMMTEEISTVAGGAMFGALLAYVVYQYVRQSSGAVEETMADEVEEVEFRHPFIAIGALLSGLVAIWAGSEFLIAGTVQVAGVLGVPEAIIGLTVIAFGTSLPELSTCIAAAIRREADVIIGGIVGSNAFNILSIVGLTAIIKPLPVDPSVADVDLWIMVGVSVAFGAWLVTVGKFTRPIGAVMFAGYVAFIAMQAYEAFPADPA